MKRYMKRYIKYIYAPFAEHVELDSTQWYEFEWLISHITDRVKAERTEPYEMIRRFVTIDISRFLIEKSCEEKYE